MCQMMPIQTNCGSTVMVADIKKACIENIMKAASLCDKIEAIYLFGSALEHRCMDESDIDIAIISNISRTKLFRNKSYDSFVSTLYSKDNSQDYDILQFDSREKLVACSEIYNEIKNKGCLIYKRDSYYV